jgi:hypothetical protein
MSILETEFDFHTGGDVKDKGVKDKGVKDQVLSVIQESKQLQIPDVALMSFYELLLEPYFKVGYNAYSTWNKLWFDMSSIDKEKIANYIFTWIEKIFKWSASCSQYCLNRFKEWY